MNKRNAIFTIVGTLVLGGAALIAGVSMNVAEPAKEIKAEANTTTRLWLDVSHIAGTLPWWSTTETYVTLQTGTSTYEHDKMTRASGSTTLLYYDVATTTWSTTTGMEFYVYNTDSAQNKTTWSSTRPDSGIPTYFYITSANSSATQNYDYYYFPSDVCAYSTPATPSYSTMRIWWSAGDHASWFFNQKVGIYDWSDSTKKVYFGTAYTDAVSSLTYYYADVPASLTEFCFVKVFSGNNAITAFSNNVSAMAPASVHYVYQDYDGDTNKCKISQAGPATVGGLFAAKVLETYTTCLSSTLNGYGAYSNLNTNFYSKLSGTELTNFNTASISDYSYGDYVSGNKSYSGLSKTAISTTGAEKWARMAALSAANPSQAYSLTGENKVVEDVSAVAAVGALGVMGVAGYFLLKKKKIA